MCVTPPPPMSIDNTHTSPAHGMNEAVDKMSLELWPISREKLYLDLQLLALVALHWISTHNFSIGREREMFYLTMHSTHFIYGYMASDIWLRTILIVRKETCCHHIGYSFRLAARVLLYAPSHRQDNTVVEQSCDTITSTCANILKHNRSSFMTDTDGSPKP